ncbi:MAG: alginate lyase family protein [Deltaproteobacteria bacterium]|nr:alginate lyase family protein [Deltaproteobacteria bacterium]
MTFQRLLKMGMTELAYRGRQEVSKRLDRVLTKRIQARLSTLFSETARDSSPFGIQPTARPVDFNGTGRRALFDRLHRTGSERFFEGAVTEHMGSLFAEQFSKNRNELLAAANSVCRKRFDLLGYRNLFFGDPVDWHLDPVAGRRAPLVHWSEIDPLDWETVGDSKIIWELNRHQWILPLGQAYRLTGDERYAEAFAGSFHEWLEANPPGIGINWTSSLELALRLISWSWALFLFRDSKTISPELFSLVIEQMSLHAAHVQKYLSYYFAPNTHLTGEALGLFYAGLLFSGMRQGRRWRDLGVRILLEQSERHILPDGVYFEQSTCYQRYTVEIYLHFLILAARNGIAIPEALGKRVQALLDFLLAIRNPDGSIPQIGDADGGWLLPLAPRAHDDFGAIFSTAAVWFRRPDYAWAAGGLGPETLWLLGPSAMKAFEELNSAPPKASPSRTFSEGGYVVMQNGWEENGHRLIFDVGPLGCPFNAGHGHADLLSLQCSVFGEPILIDPGTYCYTSEPEWRDYFRSTAAHNAVVVDDASQAEPAGPFKWKARPGARLRNWVSCDAYDFADAEHDAYHYLPDPVTHRRRVAFIKPRYWIVLDDLEGKAEHRVELRFQFAPVEVILNSENWARASGSRGRGVWIKSFATVPVQARLCKGDRAPISGWISPAYGQREAAPALSYSAVAALPLRILTLLLPVEELSGVVPHVSLLVDNASVPVGLSFGTKERVIFDDDGVRLATSS